MDRQELKPCPFCGAREWTIRPAYQVQCPRCGAEGPNGAIHATAKEAWNTRHPDTAEAEGERLREAIQRALDIGGLRWSEWGDRAESVEQELLQALAESGR